MSLKKLTTFISHRRRTFLISLVVISAIAIYPAYKLATLASPGFCDAQKRFFTDDEFIEIAIRDQLRYKKINIDGSETSIRGFRTKYPDCCAVQRRTDGSVLQKLTDFQEVLVHLKYEIRREQIEINPYYEAYVVLGTCGRLIESYGTTIEKM